MKIAENMLEANNSHDLDAILKLYSEDVTYLTPEFPEPIQGKQALKEGWQIYLRTFPDFKKEISIFKMRERSIFHLKKQ